MTRIARTVERHLVIDELSFDTIKKIVGILESELQATNIKIGSYEDESVENDEWLIVPDIEGDMKSMLTFSVPLIEGDPISKIRKLLNP